MAWIHTLLFFFVVSAHAESYQFQGIYYEHTNSKTCHRLNAVVNLDMSEAGNVLSIDIPEASCKPIFYSSVGLPLHTSVLPYYTIEFKAQNNCDFYSQEHAYFTYQWIDGKVVDPILYSKQGRWPHTHFEMGQHNLVRPCE